MLGKINASLSNKMKDVEWGEYSLEKLFEIVGTKSLDSNAIEFTKTGINFVGRTFENNGIQGKIQERNFAPNEPFTITATVIGNYKYVKYQKEPYYCSQNINKLTPKPIISKWNERIAYFFVANVQKFVSLYDNQQGGYKLENIKKHIIKLPLKDGNIYFDFIEEFVKELEKEKLLLITNYLKNNGLDNYALTTKETDVLNNYKNIEFNNYDITKVFNVKNTKNILSRDIVENSGTIPYLCASAENNAVSSYITYKENLRDKGNCIFIGGKTFVVTYQESDFYSNDSHNLVLYLKNSERTKLNQLYLVTCVNKSLGYKYSWGNSVSREKIQFDEVALPTNNGDIDFESMTTFISAIIKLIIKDVVIFVDKKRSEI